MFVLRIKLTGVLRPRRLNDVCEQYHKINKGGPSGKGSTHLPASFRLAVYN